jgi:hypothetical protein
MGICHESEILNFHQEFRFFTRNLSLKKIIDRLAILTALQQKASV